MRYKIVWLREGYNLENFKGKIIEVLQKQEWVDEYESYWSLQCLVEYEVE